jgi:hypothetical protein
MNKKIAAVGVLGVLSLAVSFGIGHKLGSMPSACEKIGHKIEAADAFCASLVDQAIEQSCAGVEEAQQSACQQIVGIQAAMACESMTNKADLIELLKKGC